MASVYKRGNVYYAKLYAPGSSQPIRKSTGEAIKELAQQAADRMEEALAAGHGEDTAIHTLGKDDAWRAYEGWARDRKKSKTLREEAIFWEQFWRWAPTSNLYALTPDLVRAYKEHLSTTPSKHGRLRSPHSVNDALRVMSTILTRIEEIVTYTGGNPFAAKNVARPRLPKARPKFLTQSQMDTALVAAKYYSIDAYLFVALGLYAGLRRGEILNLRWRHLDFDRTSQAGSQVGSLTIWDEDGYTLKTDGSNRVVPMHPKLKGVLSNRARAGDSYVIRPDSKPRPEAPRWDSRRAFRSISERVGIKVTPHMLRHTFGSQLAMQGVSIYKISKWMGHAHVSTTEIYAHIAPVDEEIGRL